MIGLRFATAMFAKSIKKVCLLTMTAALLLSATQVFAVQVDGVRLWRAPDNTRIVLDLSGPVEHKLFTLSSPNRVVIDIADTQLKQALKELPISNTPIASFRYGVRDGDDLRIVMDLKQSVSPRSFILRKHGDKPDRLVVDLYDEQKQTIKTLATIQPEQASAKRDIIIAVDAGHGGEDPGAIGPRRIYEKDVVLKISQNLVRMINAKKGYKAYLVRTGDYYIPLSERRQKARQMRADLFVSIHADAFKHPSAHGASVFALSKGGATSETARFLASKENEADLIGGVGSVNLAEVDKVVAGVLLDLSMTATLTSSLEVGQRVLNEIGGVTKLHKRRVEQASFAVLKSPDVPSILVETGFISNPKEAKKLATQSHRQQLARAILKGLEAWFYDKPPPGSYIAWAKENKQNLVDQEYVIARGDTLSAIAKRHNVSLVALMKHNGLNSKAVIRVGQRLVIPNS